MRKAAPLFVFFAIVISMAICLNANASSNKTRVLSPDKLSHGMKFYGQSTLGPDGQTRFTGKVLGVLKDTIGAGHNWIVAQLDGENFKETGVISGQSGSPVFVKVNGEEYFIGTISYAEEFNRNAIAYLTPAGEVLDTDSYVKDRAPVATPPPVFKKSMEGFFLSYGHAEMIDSFRRGTLDASSITASAKNIKSVSDVKSGDVLSVDLAYGDFHFGGYGTVSYVDKENKKIFLFGHPMLQLGNVEYRLAPAQVLGVQASYKGSSIIATSIDGAKSVGVITQDRETGIMGILGQEPKNFIPFNIKLVNSAGITKTYHFFSTSDRNIGPFVGATGIFNIINSWSPVNGPGTIFLKGEMVTDMGTIMLNNEFHGDGKLSNEASKSVLDRLSAILDNDYKKVNLKEVDLEVTLFDEVRVLKVEHAFMDVTSASPGDIVNIKVVLSQPGKGVKAMMLAVAIPGNSSFGKAKIAIGSADTINQLENENSSLANLRAMFENLSQKRSPNDLYVYVVYPPSQRVDSCPENINESIKRITKHLSSDAEEFQISLNATGLFNGNINGDFVIDGSDLLDLKIVDKNVSDSVPSKN